MPKLDRRIQERLLRNSEELFAGLGIELSAEARNMAQRAKRYKKKYRTLHREKLAEHNRIYRIEHKEERSAYAKAYYEEHRTEYIDRAKKYYAENREKASERAREWQRTHREQHNEYMRAYRARKRQEQARAGSPRKIGTDSRRSRSAAATNIPKNGETVATSQRVE